MIIIGILILVVLIVFHDNLAQGINKMIDNQEQIIELLKKQRSDK